VGSDISKVLREWEFDPDRIMARRFIGEDGEEVLQLRLELGMLQMNVHGRPDGKKPHGRESWLAWHNAQARQGQQNPLAPFSLKEQECMELHVEVLQFLQRALCFLRIDDHDGIIRDIDHCLSALEFAEQHASERVLVQTMRLLRPQLISLRTRARSILAVRSQAFAEARAMVETGLEEIRLHYRMIGQESQAEGSKEFRSLVSLASEVAAQQPMTGQERLALALEEAIKEENYEKAARIRDLLKQFEKPVL
jgi:hypothetical protein